MRNALVLVALFLGGMTTQTMMAQHQDNVKINKGKKHRYNNSQSIRFVENGVLFKVFTDGTFTFTNTYKGRPYRYGNNNHQVNYYQNGNRRGHRRYGNRPLQIKTDFYGNITAINNTCILYKRNGKVKQIGSIPLYHQRGFLMQVGGMSIEYNRFGDIRNTHGYINRLNKKVWHDDWITYNDWNDDWGNDRNDNDWKGRNKRNRSK